MGPTLFYQTSNIREHHFYTSNEFEQLNFGLERTDVRHRTQKAFTRLFIEHTQTSFFLPLKIERT